jgi:hypothetical protein
MPMLSIDLKKYLEEVDAMEKLVEPFVETASIERLSKIQTDLRTALKSRRSGFSWRTDKPIRIRPSTAFDSPTKKQAPTHIKFMFKSEFHIRGLGRTAKWEICSISSQIALCEDTEDKIIFHIDMKNEGQLGPVFHFQVHEDFAGKLAIPRVPFGFILPTDCLDFALAELHPNEWSLAQFGAWSITKVITGQLGRVTLLAADLLKFWKISEK